MAHNTVAAELNIDGKFAESVKQSSSYPNNLVQKQTYSAALHAHRQRLNEEASRLFEDDAREINVPIRDYDRITNRKSCYFVREDMY